MSSSGRSGLDAAGAVGRLIGPTIFAASVLLASGCDMDSGTNPEPPQQLPSITLKEFPVGPAGDELFYRSPSDSSVTVTLDIPAGALDADTTITIDSAEVTEVAGLVSEAVFEFGPDGLEFKLPVQLTISYSDAIIGDLTEANLRIHEADGVNWISLLGDVDTVFNDVTAEIGGFSIFGLKTIPDPGGDGNGSDSGGGSDPGATDPGAIVPTWYGIQANILQKFCVGCHGGESPMKGLSWEVDQYETIVTNGYLSTELTDMLEVNPGSPGLSYMVWKLNGEGPNGEPIAPDTVRMPAFSAPLDQALIDVITQWIADGAPLGEPGDADSGSGGDAGGDGGGTGGDGGGTGGDGGGTGGDGGGTGGEGADTWTTIQADILEVKCVLCHNNNFRSAGLSWEADQYDTIVTNGRLSTQITDMLEINPGFPEQSYMVWKINGKGPNNEPIAADTVRMPATGVALSQATIDRIEAWIADGAPGPAGDTGGGDTGGGGTGGGGTGGGDTGGGDTGGGADPDSIVPTWYGVQANILQPFCVGCHQGTAAPEGLSWEVDQYDNIVTNGRMSNQITDMLEINPDNPELSYMLWKINGEGPNGESIAAETVRMPATGIPLDQALIDVLTQWIAEGALLGEPEDADSGGSTTPAFPEGSWMYVWTEALQVCTLCHSQTPSSERCGTEFDCPPKDVILTADNYNGVVDRDEVEPFDLDGSKLWERVTDPDPDKRMPFGMSPLSASQLNIIRNWIEDGAPFCPDGEVCP